MGRATRAWLDPLRSPVFLCPAQMSRMALQWPVTTIYLCLSFFILIQLSPSYLPKLFTSVFAKLAAS